MEFSRDRDVKNVQRHLVAAVRILRSKKITSNEYDGIVEFIDLLKRSLDDSVIKEKQKPGVNYFD